jgi:hypothetical protein
MTPRRNLLTLTICCLAAASLIAGAACADPAPADNPGAAQAKAAGKKAPDTVELGERVDALEKENTVLREDLGKARLDARTRLSELEKRDAEARRRLQEKIDALSKDLDREAKRQARRNRNMWIVAGILALGIIASD